MFYACSMRKIMPENKNLFFQLTKNLKNNESRFISNYDGRNFSYQDMINFSGSFDF